MRINPNVLVVPLARNVLGEVGTAFFGAFDVVVGAVDTREGRLAINRACWRMNRPFIDGALDVLGGLVKVFVPPDSACYECTMTEDDYRLLPRRDSSCGLLARAAEAAGAAPTTPVSAAVIGALQVQEVLKLLHPAMATRRLRGEGYVFDGLHFEPMLLRYPRKADGACGSHETYPAVHALPGSRDRVTLTSLIDWARGEHGLACSYVAHRDVLTLFRCDDCGHEEPVHRPYVLYRGDPGPCPGCGSGARRAAWRGGVAPGELPPGATVADLGLPPMDVLTLQGDGPGLHVTLTGDRHELLPDAFFTGP
jgi:adenylyltransferase/sulfurtransferase